MRLFIAEKPQVAMAIAEALSDINVSGSSEPY